MIGNNLEGRNYEGVILLGCKAALSATYQYLGQPAGN